MMNRIWILCVSLLVISGIASGSSMVFGLPGSSNFRPAISRTQLALIIRALQLTEDQIHAVQDLHAAHTAELQSAGATYRAELEDRIDRAEMLGDLAVAQSIFQDAQQWEEREEELERSFLLEMRLLLDADQDARWSLVQREMRRIKAMPFGRMLGENLDVISMVESLGLDPNPEMLAVLDRYARDLDPALQARDEFLRVSAVEADESLATDPKRAKQLFERSRSLRRAVRDINIRSIDQLASAASPEDAARIHGEYQQRMARALGLPESRLDEMIQAIGGLPSLTTSQRDRIGKITESYRASRKDWDARYVDAAIRAEDSTVPPPLRTALGAEESNSRADDTKNDDGQWTKRSERSTIESLRRLWEERIDLDRSTREALRAMLDEAQREAIVTKRNEVTVQVGNLFGTEEYFGL